MVQIKLPKSLLQHDESTGSYPDVGRVMEIPLGEVDKIAKLIPSTSPSIEDALQNVIEFKQVYEEASRKEEKRYIKELIDIAAQMVGVVRSVGTHAAGVVITDKPLVDYLPLHRPTGSAEETRLRRLPNMK
jgi:DNA polymerase-3 subunit alpha